ncbi:DsbC family protein [Acidihalobacter aeolianus]|nr:DsbC family protein [Acidihalobacter aeolianus]
MPAALARLFALILACCLLMPAAALADAGKTAADNAKALRQRLVKLIPGQAPDSVQPTPIPGLFQVRYGLKVFYLTGNGRYLIQGQLVDLKDRQNLTDTSLDKARLSLLDTLPASSFIEYRPKGKARYTISVFSDVDCPYCRALHAEVPALNRKGVAVRYLFFPRSGPDTPSYYTAVSAWCAKDRQTAFTRAMEGKAIPKATCANPVKRDFDLGVRFGVEGTPTIVLQNGQVLPGYLPVDKLMQAIKDASAS